MLHFTVSQRPYLYYYFKHIPSIVFCVICNKCTHFFFFVCTFHICTLFWIRYMHFVWFSLVYRHFIVTFHYLPRCSRFSNAQKNKSNASILLPALHIFLLTHHNAFLSTLLIVNISLKIQLTVYHEWDVILVANIYGILYRVYYYQILICTLSIV